MLGIGRFVKSAALGVANGVSDASLSLTNPAAVDFMRRLQRESCNPDYFWHVLAPLNCLYAEVPKAASSTLLAIFSQLLKGEPVGDAAKISQSRGVRNPRSAASGPRRFL